MKQAIIFISILFQAILCLSAREPIWMSDLELDFPKDKYIARLGSGNSPDNARANAVGQIASFFNSEVVVKTTATSNLANDGENVVKNQEINQKVDSVSDMTLTAVEYTLPYYKRKKKTYYVVAYINRELAWQNIEPKIIQLRTKYDSFIELAKNAEHPFLEYKYLIKAKALSEELMSLFYTGVLFDSSKKKAYKDLISEISQSQELEMLNSFRIPLYVTTNGDYENLITAKVIEAFKELGFIPHEELKGNIRTILKIEINSNEKISDEICSVYPETSIYLSNIDETKIFYSYQKSWGKTSNFSLAQAKKKSFSKIAGEFKKKLIDDYRNKNF